LRVGSHSHRFAMTGYEELVRQMSPQLNIIPLRAICSLRDVSR
jgi:hypothetical protein